MFTYDSNPSTRGQQSQLYILIVLSKSISLSYLVTLYFGASVWSLEHILLQSPKTLQTKDKLVSISMLTERLLSLRVEFPQRSRVCLHLVTRGLPVLASCLLWGSIMWGRRGDVQCRPSSSLKSNRKECGRNEHSLTIVCFQEAAAAGRLMCCFLS